MVYNGGKLRPRIVPAYTADEVSAIVVDFGSHTTRAGYAGEDGPRVIAPSFYGYKDVESGGASASGTNGNSNGGADGDDPMDGDEKKENSGDNDNNNIKKKTYYFGDDGVNVWRSGMEVGNFMVDGMGEVEKRVARAAMMLGGRETRLDA